MYNKNQDNIDKLAHFYDIGLIDENGYPIPLSIDDKHVDDM